MRVGDYLRTRDIFDITPTLYVRNLSRGLLYIGGGPFKIPVPFMLRVHDLKTGLKPIEDPTQLVIYCALFCLDYKVSPEQCKRIIVAVYQNGEIKSCEVSVEQLNKVIERMKHVNEVSEEGGLLV